MASSLKRKMCVLRFFFGAGERALSHVFTLSFVINDTKKQYNQANNLNKSFTYLSMNVIISVSSIKNMLNNACKYTSHFELQIHKRM